MKKTLLILASLITVNLYSSEIDTVKLNSQIKDVTVFIDGAQITREVNVVVSKGKHLLILENLPAEINSQSIQIDNNQKGEILLVKHELTYPKEKSKTVLEYEEKIKLQKNRLNEITNEISVYNIEEKILIDNSVLNKKSDGSSVVEIKEASIFYRLKLNEIRKNILKLTNEFDLVKENIQNLYIELNKKVSKENKTYSKITFTFSSEIQINASFRISYFVSSAGWLPLYDFRVNDISKPLNLVYNASIYQSTGEDWNNVNLTLSTNRPSLNNIKPELEPWFADKKNNSQKKVIIDGQSAMQGIVTDKENGNPIPFANIVVYKNGETIAGVTTDFDGRYTIKPIKSGYYDIKISSVGYENLEMKEIVLNAGKITFQDFNIKQKAMVAGSVQVVEYKSPMIDMSNTSSGITITSENITRMPARSDNNYAAKVGSVKELKSDEVVTFIDGYKSNTNITSLEYKIDIPYSIPSDGKDYSVKIKEVKVPVHYIYSCVPKLDKDVFLITEINNWQKMNLLSGKSSIYYNGIFTGQSEIDTKNTKDTLSISLNRDKNIIVDRTLLKEKNEKRFVGNNIIETINWSITIKNNKDEKIKIIIEDQFPISENSSVIIEKLEASNGKVNKKTGKITWELELGSNELKELSLIYSVKYPSYMKLNIEQKNN